MNQYLKDNNIEMAAQRATAVLSVVNHALPKEVRLRDKIQVRLLLIHKEISSHVKWYSLQRTKPYNSLGRKLIKAALRCLDGLLVLIYVSGQRGTGRFPFRALARRKRIRCDEGITLEMSWFPNGGHPASAILFFLGLSHN